MARPQALKIDLGRTYPCPCRREGNLSQITLTEALGCDRCQRIFVVNQEGEVLEQVSNPSGHHQAWHWDGTQWYLTSSSLRGKYLPLGVGIGILLLILWIPVAFSSLTYTHGIGLVIVSIVLVTFLIVFWFADRS